MSKWRLDRGQIEVIDDAVAEALRAKTMAESVAMISQCHKTMRSLIEAHVRWTHPDWDDAQVNAEIVRRMLNGTG
jgi:Arc/MetJ family transcription regulator